MGKGKGHREERPTRVTIGGRFSSRSVIPRLRSSSRHSVRPAKRRLRRVRSVERRREEAAGRGRTTDDQGSGSFIVLHSSLYTYAAQPGGRGPDRQGPRSGPGPSRLRRVLVTELNEDTSSEVNRVCLSSFPLLSSLVTFSPLTLVPSSLHTRRRQERGDRALRDEVTREWRKREAYGLGSLGPTGHSMLPAQPSYRRSFTYSINE